MSLVLGDPEYQVQLGNYSRNYRRTAGDVLSGGKPHPRSYRPDLPMVPQLREEQLTDRNFTAHPTSSLTAWADSVVKAEAKRHPLADDVAHVAYVPEHAEHLREIPKSTSKPHPRSYRPDLPTGGFSCASLMRATADDKEYWSEHALAYDAQGLAYYGYVKPCDKCGGRAAAAPKD